jgi:hypothetical protein
MGITFEPREDMKLCPFCNGVGYLQYVVFKDNTTWYNPSCIKTGCIQWNTNYETKEEAVIKWNERIKC